MENKLYADESQIVTIKVKNLRKCLSYEHVDFIEEQKIYKHWYDRLICNTKIEKTRRVGWRDNTSFFGKYSPIYTTEDMINLGYIVDGFALYHKPYITIRFSNQDTFEKSFKTMDDLASFLEPLLERNTNLKKMIEYDRF